MEPCTEMVTVKIVMSSWLRHVFRGNVNQSVANLDVNKRFFALSNRKNGVPMNCDQGVYGRRKFDGEK